MKQLAMDAGCTPQRVLEAYSSDQVPNLFVDLWSTTATSGLPSPVRREAHSMPAHDCLGPDDRYGIEDVRKAPIKPNEQSAIGPTQMQSTWRTPSKHVQLMPQHQDLGFKPPS
jgi:hypothetical protein